MATSFTVLVSYRSHHIFPSRESHDPKEVKSKPNRSLSFCFFSFPFSSREPRQDGQMNSALALRITLGALPYAWRGIEKASIDLSVPRTFPFSSLPSDSLS
ncbi:hypothetical protein BT93_K2109 [Corymbia citriodora subsp. variegata]|nr:hypothetical protein BT93_K2109 [Corymbia citriodora subsp. variegata]